MSLFFTFFIFAAPVKCALSIPPTNTNIALMPALHSSSFTTFDPPTTERIMPTVGTRAGYGSRVDSSRLLSFSSSLGLSGGHGIDDAVVIVGDMEVVAPAEFMRLRNNDNLARTSRYRRDDKDSDDDGFWDD